MGDNVDNARGWGRSNELSTSDFDGDVEIESLLAKEPVLKDTELRNWPTLQEGLSERLWALMPSTLRRRCTESQRDQLNQHQQNASRLPIRQPKSKRSMCLWITVLIFGLYGIVHVILLVIGVMFFHGEEGFRPEWAKPDLFSHKFLEYATDFTGDVKPVPCHSHNDYWRHYPLFEALHYGCTGVEADVWLFNDELFVGHDTSSLAPERTFRNMYVRPLRKILDRQNPSTQFAEPTRNGVFDEDREQSTILLVDLKTDGYDTFPVVRDQLSALREKNYLTYFNGTGIVKGPITVVATGNAPFDLLVSNDEYRDVFFDAPLVKIWEDSQHKSANAQPPMSITKRGQGQEGLGDIDSAAVFTPHNSFYASVSFAKTFGWPQISKLSEAQKETIRSQVDAVHAQGLKARYWDTPSWPVGLRNHVWRELVRAGADMINADDLKSCSKGVWRTDSWVSSAS